MNLEKKIKKLVALVALGSTLTLTSGCEIDTVAYKTHNRSWGTRKLYTNNGRHIGYYKVMPKRNTHIVYRPYNGGHPYYFNRHH